MNQASGPPMLYRRPDAQFQTAWIIQMQPRPAHSIHLYPSLSICYIEVYIAGDWSSSFTDDVVDTQTMFATNVTQAVHSSRSSFAGSAASFSTSKTVVRAPAQQLRVEGMFGDGHLALAGHATVRCFAWLGVVFRGVRLYLCEYCRM